MMDVETVTDLAGSAPAVPVAKQDRPNDLG